MFTISVPGDKSPVVTKYNSSWAIECNSVMRVRDNRDK